MGSLKPSIADVVSFHKKNDILIGDFPKVPCERIVSLRTDLISEEFGELTEAISENDIDGVADGCIDLIYVVIGTALSYGIDLDLLWKSIHENNMSKKKIRDKRGKIIKSPTHKPPPIKEILRSQGSLLDSYSINEIINGERTIGGR